MSPSPRAEVRISVSPFSMSGPLTFRTSLTRRVRSSLNLTTFAKLFPYSCRLALTSSMSFFLSGFAIRPLASSMNSMAFWERSSAVRRFSSPPSRMNFRTARRVERRFAWIRPAVLLVLASLLYSAKSVLVWLRAKYATPPTTMSSTWTRPKPSASFFAKVILLNTLSSCLW